MGSIDFRKIRTIRGSASNGFEELCCQLAAEEPSHEGARFVRNGTPDGGVECYWSRPDGSENGYQAKYFFTIGDKQWAQLDESVETALSAHPGLTHYTICLPIDLPDARVGRQKSLRQKWDNRVVAWNKKAEALGRSVTFELWGEHEILRRLSLPVHAGRRWFFFREVEFSATWFADHLQEAIDGAGPRYSTELNIELPIARRFDALGYTGEFREAVDGARRRCRRALEAAVQGLGRTCLDQELAKTVDELHSSGLALLEALARYSGTMPSNGHHRVVAEALRATGSAAQGLDQRLYRLAKDTRLETPPEHPPPSARPFEHERHLLQRLEDELHEFESWMDASSSELADRPAMLLVGQAGSGKTHLLCDVASRHLAAGLPSIVLLGQQFGGGDVWAQAIQRLGLSCTRDELLGALEAAAIATDCRALILVDAINEASEINWRAVLPGILTLVSRYPRVGLAVSCRTTYERDLIREDLCPDRLSRVRHDGFAPRLFEAIGAFCRYYRIETLNAPPLNPEFENPLFLKLFCQGLNNKGLSRPPKGQHGLGRVFSFLIESVNEKLHFPDELDFPINEPVVQQAVDAIADAMEEAGGYSIPLRTAREILDRLLERPGVGHSRSLLGRLTSEGILAEDLQVARDDGPADAVVRFGYERLADFQIARRLLERHVGRDDPFTAFRGDGYFARLFADEARSYRLRGLLAALIVLVPERLGREVGELLPHLEGFRSFREAFLEALPWREGPHITTHAVASVERMLAAGDHGSPNYCASDDVMERVVQLAAMPDHPLNAGWLHTRLLRLEMPDRDLHWSTFLHRAWSGDSAGERSSIERLLDWAWPDDAEVTDPCSGFDDEVVTLVAIALTWCFTASNRFVRDRATKALVSVLRHRPGLIPNLLHEFRSIDDPYVLERLHGAVYGCVTRNVDPSHISSIASTVHTLVFASGTPHPHLLLRDYARGTIEYAASLGCTLGFDLAEVRPPYRSEPPPEDAASWDELHKRYREDGYNGLIHSLWPDHGDFARYVMGSDSTGLHTWVDTPGLYDELRRLEGEQGDLPDELGRAWWEVTLGSRLGRIKIVTVAPGNQEIVEGDEIDPSAEAIESAEMLEGQVDRFLESLSRDERDLIEKHERAEHRIREAQDRAEEAEHRLHADGSLPCRWVFTRVLEMGWRPERFAVFDRGADRGYVREAHKPERIGKKYQWIAYHELAARVTDHRPVRYVHGSREYRYDGPWQRHFRDIDPSFLARKPREEFPSGSWWVPIADPISGAESQAGPDWLTDRDTIPDFTAMLEVIRPTERSHWHPLRVSGRWEREAPEEGGEHGKQVSFSAGGFLVRSQDADKLVEAASVGSWSGMDITPPDLEHQFLGEFAWAPSFRELIEEAGLELTIAPGGDYFQLRDFPGTDFPIAHTAMMYTQGSQDFDCSVDESISGYVPSVWLARRMDLTWGRQGFSFSDRDGKTVAFDPSHAERGPGALLVEKGALARFLSSSGLEIVWLVIGEKMLSGDLDDTRDRESIRISVFRQVYRLVDGRIRRVARTMCPLGGAPSPY